MAERPAEAGFTLIEVAICTALLFAACVSALGVLPTLVHESQSGLLRDAATDMARAAIDRVRAATGYDPPSGYSATHAFALNPSAAYVAAAHVHRGLCDPGASSTDVPMNVQLAYDSGTDTITATVSYPRDGCRPAPVDEVVLQARLAPSALAPGTSVSTAIDDPSQQ